MPQAVSNLHPNSFHAYDAGCCKGEFERCIIRTQLIDGKPWYFSDDVACSLRLYDLDRVDRHTESFGRELYREIPVVSDRTGPYKLRLLSLAGVEALSKCKRGPRAARFAEWMTRGRR